MSHERDSTRAFCFECGNQLVVGVYAERDYHGTTVKMHKGCAERFDDDEKPITAALPVVGARADA